MDSYLPAAPLPAALITIKYVRIINWAIPHVYLMCARFNE